MAVAISQEPPARFSSLQPLWHRTAPRRLTKKCPADDPLQGWTAWKKHLSGRKSSCVPALVCGKRPALFWGWRQEWGPLPAVGSAAAHSDAEQFLAATASDFAESSSNEPVSREGIDLHGALQAVAIAYSLPRLANELTGDSWWQLVERLHDLAIAAQVAQLQWPCDPHQVLRMQLLAGELPLALGFVLPEVRALRELASRARAALSDSLAELTDGRGLPHSRLFSVFAPLLACWTRVRWLGERTKHGCWSDEAERQYRWLVQHALRLADARGQFMLVPRDEQAAKSWPRDLFAMAIDLVGTPRLCAAAACAISPRIVPRNKRQNHENLPAPSLESDWSGVSVLASGWSRDDTRLAVAFADDPVRIELETGRDKILAGGWMCETTCDGAPVSVADEWEEVSWETGARFDYLELGVELTHDLRLERQLLLARDDDILFVADTLMSRHDGPRRLQHTIRLPLAPGVEWRPENETRDGVLVAGKFRAAVLPLALHEWRSDPRGGSLVGEAGQLVLTQEITGRALCCPLVIDLKPRRSARERTWRQLTVAESLNIVPSDMAVGYRAQSGDDQWVFYRSLGPPANRTLLGYNIAGEFAAGRFLRSGKVKEWLEVEEV